MPEKEYSVGLVAHKPRTIDHVGLAGKKRLEYRRVLLRTVLKVGVLHDEKVSGGGEKTAPHGRALSLILFLKQNRIASGLFELSKYFPRPVGRAVIHDDYF